MSYPPGESTYSHWFVTLWPAGRMLRRLGQYGAYVGVRVAHQHDGALMFRQHLLTATGPDRAARKFGRVAARVISRNRRSDRSDQAAAVRRALDALTDADRGR
ncbi:hypothetical protein [Nonomuraea sp. NPDC005650]|uniref:hypothetical protein n=1 Tax=Nonomuraea sp. NPDC005650 TaxID=3157045 RepID=UPI0033A589B4